MWLRNHAGWSGLSLHICDKMQFLMLRESFYKPKHEDPDGAYWLGNNGHFLYWLKKHKQKINEKKKKKNTD